MRRTFSTVILLCAWLCANGALLDAMQAFAWVRMFTGYTETMSIPAALRETFDPAKPCDMCMSVAKVKETQQKQLPPAGEQAGAKFVLAIHAPDSPVFANDRGDWVTAPPVASVQRNDPVPVPPPRA